MLEANKDALAQKVKAVKFECPAWQYEVKVEKTEPVVEKKRPAKASVPRSKIQDSVISRISFSL